MPGDRLRGLPDFPWDSLGPFAEQARAHPGGIVNLSVGTPVDPVPLAVQRALAEAADAPGYPTTHGSPELRESIVAWARRTLGVDLDPVAVLPLIGTKEFVGWLPTMLGLGAGDIVAFPEVAYPTYEMGALVAGCQPNATDSIVGLGPQVPALMWVNSPSNPTGRVLGVEHLRKVVQWARDNGVIVASDECYITLAWDAEPVSILDPRVCDGDYTGLLMLHSLSKHANLAGYRAGFVAGDPALVSALLELRKHVGMMVPAPVQAAAAAAYADDEDPAIQRERYRERREVLRAAVEAAGFRVDESAAGLYLWTTWPGGDGPAGVAESAALAALGPDAAPCWQLVQWFADRGILVAPGDFYGPRGAAHVRIALTATDDAIAAAAARLGS